MTRRNPQLHRLACQPPGREARESGSVAVEVAFFVRLWNRGESLERLRADILPGRDSSEWGRKFRVRVLEQFERTVENAQRGESVA